MSEQMTPGERIKQARKNAKLTQEELGCLVNVTGVSIMRYEKGERSPDYMTTCRLASALKLKIEYLMSEAAKGWYEAGYEEGYDSGYEEAVTGANEIIFNATPDPEWVDLETKLKNGTITPEELQRYKDLNTIMAENTHRDVENVKLRLQKIMKQLNDAGLQKVVERAEELTEIPRYRAETAPQSLPAPQEGTDTTPPPDAPETPPEGE